MKQILKLAAAGTALLGSFLLARVVWHAYSSESAEFERWPATNIDSNEGFRRDSVMSVRLADGAVAGWYWPSKNRAAIILAHGTNADHSTLLGEAAILSDAGFGVLAFDWLGYGASNGDAKWGEDERAALSAAIDWLSTQTDVDPKRIGGFGFSMGGYIMAQVAVKDERLRSIVFASTPPDVAEEARWEHRRWGVISEYPADWALRRSGMPFHEMLPKDVIAAIAPRPILIIGGTADEAVPEFMTRELYAVAAEPKALWIVPGARHGGYLQAAPLEYQRRLIGFFSETLTQ